ncbi:hypothetical protein N0V92_005134 [Colletotrichum tropicale]|nr:hypothetical protein N0V92_005134 [Colletotrichum tropicale]
MATTQTDLKTQDVFVTDEPIEDCNLTSDQLAERMQELLGEGFRFENRTYPSKSEVIEKIILDTLALDRQTAALKAAKAGKDPRTQGQQTDHTRPVYIPSSSEKLSTEEYNRLMTKTFPKYETMKPGEWSEENTKFVAWDLVKRYPSNYIGKTNRPKCTPFFKNMTEEHTWDFFYVYHPKALDQAPFIFIPTEQFDHFLDIINASVQTKLTIPPGKPSEKFYLTFGSSCTIRPKYIGRSSSHNEYKALQNAIPAPEDEDACKEATVHGMEFLLANLSAHAKEDQPKSKSKKRKQEKTQSREENIYDAQLYLGIRPLPSVTEGKDKKVKVDEPVPHVLDKDVVFMCIDIEVAEEHHGTVLEVGMTTLDTRDIVGVPPGKVGRDWFPYIKSRHLITEDYKHIVNKKYIKGCPDLFDFGESEYPKRKDLRDEILNAFAELSSADKDKPPRNIVLVGHGLSSDLTFMTGMDVHPWSVPGMIRCLDTKDMHQAWREETQGRSLVFVLQDLDIPSKNLHNAGNDAAYTLRAMLGLAVRAKIDEQAAAEKKVVVS